MFKNWDAHKLFFNTSVFLFFVSAPLNLLRKPFLTPEQVKCTEGACSASENCSIVKVPPYVECCSDKGEIVQGAVGINVGRGFC